MGPSRGINALLAALLVLLLVALGVLAVLQYGWIDRVSDAERQRMRANIDFASRRFIDEFRGELGELFETFARPEGGDLGQRYDAWASSARHPRLVASIHVMQRDADAWSVRQLDLDTLQLLESSWPPALESQRRQIEGRARWPPPFLPEVPGLLIAPRRGPPGQEFREELANLRPAIFVQLDRAQLTNAILPELAAQHFATGTDKYDVAVMRGNEVLFRSDRSWPDGRTKPDVEMSFVAFEPAGPRGEFRGAPPPHREVEPWRLLVRRRDAALETLVASARRRNLALSFGMLFVLAATVVLLLALLRRADRLRAQQTQFVAAMTHELNTPIAALRSAGENLKDGIVDAQKVSRYGEAIVKESARLGELVAQVLDFAGIQARANARVAHEPVDVEAIVGEAVDQCRGLSDAVSIEMNVDAGVPRVRGDAQALTRAIHNLVANAIRHGGSGGWVGVRASRNGNGVAITIEDRGPGIDARDASRLFEPFYRGRGSQRVRGAGLGLAIVEQIARAHGGSIEVDRKRRDGAAFTIHLPAEAQRG